MRQFVKYVAGNALDFDAVHFLVAGPAVRLGSEDGHVVLFGQSPRHFKDVLFRAALVRVEKRVEHADVHQNSPAKGG